MVIFLLSCTTVVFADSITEKQNELKGVKEDIEQTKGEIERVKEEQAEIINQIAEIEIDLKEKQRQLEEIENALIETQENMKLTEAELDDAIEKAELHKELMDERLCAMYMSSNTSYLEILFEAKSFTDFLDRMEMVKEIISLDQEVLDQMMAIKAEIEEKKNSLEEEKLIEEAVKEDITDQKSAIEAKQRKKETLLTELKSQQKDMEFNLGQLEGTSKDLEAAIQKLVAEREAEEKRKREEAEKKRLAELAAAQKEQENNSGSNNNSDNGNNSGSNNNSGSTSRGTHSGRMIWPAPGYTRITSYYGYRIHPVTGQGKSHTGIDIGAPEGANAVAALGGKVVLAQYNGGYGNCVEIDHGNGIRTLYGHGLSLCVSVGDIVSQGQLIMKVGSTGVSTGPHLHFEVRVNGSHVNPLDYLQR